LCFVNANSIDRTDERERLARAVAANTGIGDKRLIDVFRRIPRHRFVPTAQAARAYDDRALPIGEEQTISQPSMIALMFDALRPEPGDRALEVGAGSGYAAAVASQLVREVVATERIGGLAARAARALANVGATNARVLAVDGQRGVPGAGPFDAILVSAAAERFPERLYHELAVGGRIMVPVGDDRGQRLELVRRGPHGPEVTHGVPCRFVPLLEGAS